MQKTPNKNNQRPTVNSLPVIGLSMALVMGFLAYVGVWVDEKFNVQPWGTLGGVVLGLFYCGYEFWKLIVKSKEEEKKAS